MNDRPEDFEDDDIDMGEPVTDKLNVLLDELSDEWKQDDGEVDLGEPVTDKLNALLAALPADWENEDTDIDVTEIDLTAPVTDRLVEMLGETTGEDLATRVRREGDPQPPDVQEPRAPKRGVAALLRGLVRRLFGPRS